MTSYKFVENQLLKKKLLLRIIFYSVSSIIVYLAFLMIDNYIRSFLKYVLFFINSLFLLCVTEFFLSKKHFVSCACMVVMDEETLSFGILPRSKQFPETKKVFDLNKIVEVKYDSRCSEFTINNFIVRVNSNYSRDLLAFLRSKNINIRRV